jgi:hypothetical protein
MPGDEARRGILELIDAQSTSSLSPNETRSPEPDVAVPEYVTIPLSAKMQEQLSFLAKQTKTPFDVLAHELFATELEAQVGLSRGPYLRKYMYR